MGWWSDKKEALRKTDAEYAKGKWSYHCCRVCKEKKLLVDDYVFKFGSFHVNTKFTCENCGSLYRYSKLYAAFTDLIKDYQHEMSILSFGLGYIVKFLIMDPPLKLLRFLFARYSLRLIKKKPDHLG